MSVIETVKAAHDTGQSSTILSVPRTKRHSTRQALYCWAEKEGLRVSTKTARASDSQVLLTVFLHRTP